MQFAINNAELIRKLYVDEQNSASEIAKQLGTYTLNVTRALKFLNIPIRDKSETQALLLKQNKVPHPTKGKKVSEETKIRISEKVHQKWKSFSPEKLEEIREGCRNRWEAYDDEHKELLRRTSVEGIRRSSKEGSKLEHEIISGLNEAGFLALHHHNLAEKEKLEVDIYLPEIRVAVEIDGPAHFFPIWGEDSLAKHKKADSEKNGILALNGYCVIRVKNLVNRVTDVIRRNLLHNLIEIICGIKESFPDLDQRIIYLDIETGEIE